MEPESISELFAEVCALVDLLVGRLVTDEYVEAKLREILADRPATLDACPAGSDSNPGEIQSTVG